MTKMGLINVKTRSATLALVGFVSGLSLMYVALLGRIRPIGNMSPIVTAIQEITDTTGIDLQQFQEEFLANYRNRGISVSNCSTSPGNITCTSSSSSSSSVDISGYIPKDPTLSWESLQERRRQEVAKVCKNLHYRSNRMSKIFANNVTSWRLLNDNDNMLIDGKHQVLFCTIPKVACSSWKAALALLTNKLHNRDPASLKGVHFNSFMNRLGLSPAPVLDGTKLQMAVDNYTKVMVVRHPFERLVSAYRDKFRTYNKWTKHFQLRYGRKMVLLYRGEKVSVDSLKRGHDVTFEEFLSFIVDDVIPISERINPHWDTYQHLCHPCYVKYDHVIKFETLDVDNAAVLLRYFAVTNATEFFPKRNMKSIPSKDIMMQYYSKIPKTLIHKIYNMFRTDMEMFGYVLPPELLHDSNST